jgi:2,4-didehydro-3-deoxy-L-rhamnonate hydrolase
MRLCRFTHQGKQQIGLYGEKTIVPLEAGAAAYRTATHEGLELPKSNDLLDYLPPKGKGFAAAKKLAQWVEGNDGKLPNSAELKTADVELHMPIPRPNKLILLAGNYNEHIQEGGGLATERAATFPYLFMKPPSTTLVDPGKNVIIPKVSPGAIDWELELAVVIGERCKGVPESDALRYVAGYTVVNDISNRKFRPNPNRTKRDKDSFFDWQHGKWHDSFCPCGPCVTSADAIADPQGLEMKLSLNDEVRQHASTKQQIFSVAATIEFISNILTLEPGDIIATGTPAGVGNTTGTYVKPGDVLKASIAGIGTLVSPIVAE